MAAGPLLPELGSLNAALQELVPRLAECFNSWTNPGHTSSTQRNQRYCKCFQMAIDILDYADR
ncbi:hypothetical protein O9993_12420 [Vibrio lentus]|nr:hypothetical protein [Vibrio lentus]